MAASVGKSVEEMADMEVTWEACDVVFDALSRSQSGIVDKAAIDDRRATYEDAAGGFDAEAFAADLSAAKRTIAISYAIFPGSLNLVFLVAFLEAGGIAASGDAWENLLGQSSRNLAIWSSMAGGGGM